MVHYRVHNSPPTISVLSQMHSFHKFQSHFPKIHYNIIISSKSSSSELSLLSGFPTNNLYTLLSSPMRATCPAHLIPLDLITVTTFGAGLNSRAVYGTYCLRPLEHWDRRFESCSGHGCVSACFCCVVLCVGRGLVLDWSPNQGVLPNVCGSRNPLRKAKVRNEL
jgi:hypothetical protein